MVPASGIGEATLVSRVRQYTVTRFDELKRMAWNPVGN